MVLFSVLTHVMVCATAEKSNICTTRVCMFTALAVVRVIVRVAAELLVTRLCLDVTGTVAALPEAVIALAVVITCENVWVPVKVCAASVRAIVAVVEGKVIVVLSVPASVRELLTVRVFPLARVKVPVVEVRVSPL